MAAVARPAPYDRPGERTSRQVGDHGAGDHRRSDPMSDVLFAVGLVIVLLTSASVLFTIVLPREPRGFQPGITEFVGIFGGPG